MPRKAKPRPGNAPLYTAQSLAATLSENGKPISPRRVRELAAAAGVVGLSLVDLAQQAGYSLQGNVSADRFYTAADGEQIQAARGPGRNRSGAAASD